MVGSISGVRPATGPSSGHGTTKTMTQRPGPTLEPRKCHDYLVRGVVPCLGCVYGGLVGMLYGLVVIGPD